MATDTRRGARSPALWSMRLPADPWPNAIAVNAHQVWRLVTQGATPLEEAAGNPADEYRSVCEFMRLYATLRFYQLALLLGTTGSIVTALSSPTVRASFAGAGLLKGGALLISLAFTAMEFRASSHWHRLLRRGNELAERLRFQPFPTSSRWHPATTSGAGFYVHVLVALLWLASLFLPFHLGA